MKITKIEVKNFRLLQDIEISLEDKATVIVGRNNSGKTSLTELFRRLLSDSNPSFELEDFTLSEHEKLWGAYLAHCENQEEDQIRNIIPKIEASLFVSYDPGLPEFGPLSDFIIDLDPSSTKAKIALIYKLKDGYISSFFADITYDAAGDIKAQKQNFFRVIKERIPAHFTTTILAVDPNDSTNIKPMETSKLRALLQGGFINAQRGLDDVTHKEKDVLAKVLERLFEAAKGDGATNAEKETVQKLENAVKDIQGKLDADFNTKLNEVLPAFELFGYPGFIDPSLQTETTLNVKKLLQDNTKVRYSNTNGIALPEAYNGLGARNLIYILLQILEFFKTYKTKAPAPGIHLIFIEEPEAHLHPQMQEVFINQLAEIANQFSKKFNGGNPWPVQFIVTTHSSHIANKAPFEAIRYFLTKHKNYRHTVIKDLRTHFISPDLAEDKAFLNKFLTLTKCDIFFADKALLIEGLTERIMMPKIVEKFDASPGIVKKLAGQYISTLEVGGAYAHKFFKLLSFLEIYTLIVTDIDSVDGNGGSKCKILNGSHTSNHCLRRWFDDDHVSPTVLIAKTDDEKTKNYTRLAYQIPENLNGPSGRSFEDAFMLANCDIFGIAQGTPEAMSEAAWPRKKWRKLISQLNMR